MSGLVIRGGTTPAGDRIDVAIDGERIVRVDEPDGAGSSATAGAPEGVDVLDATGLMVAPGFIDLQVNGAAGLDMTSDPASMWAVAAALARYGVTAFLPTIVTSPSATIDLARSVLGAGPPPGHRGARAVGLHLEGPFLNPARCGVHDPALLREPDPALADAWSRDSGVRLVTLAPELPGAGLLIRRLVDRGVIVSAGHSAAGYEEARAAIDAGVRYGTHLWNAMPQLEHRAPGLIAALLDDDRVVVGLITDGIHLHPATVDLTWRAAGARRISVVTDAVSALGVPDGAAPQRIGGARINVGADGARAGGRLAGGVIGLDAIVRNLVAFTGASTAEAIATVTSVPARLLGLADRHDQPTAGDVADLTLLTSSLEVAATIVGGRVVYTDPSLVAGFANLVPAS